MNVTKLLIYPTHYLNPKLEAQTIRSELDPKLPLFIVSHTLAPLAISKLANPVVSNTHWLFPSIGQIVDRDEDTKRIQKFLRKEIHGNKSYWLTRRFNISHDNIICVLIPASPQTSEFTENKVFVQLEDNSLILRDHRSILVKTEKVKAGCELVSNTH